MDLISVLITNIIPLYILIILGFMAGKWFDVNLNSIAKILIYFLAPVVTFGAILNINFDATYILLPIILFIISTTISLGSYGFLKLFWKDGTANLIGAGGVNGNALYFGVPIVSALLGPTGLGLWMLMNLGPSINNFTLAYYLTARGSFSVKKSLYKVITLPVLHAAILAIILNIYGFKLPDIVTTYWDYSTGAFVILGMMLIGIALSKQEKFELDTKLIFGSFSVKFLIWPAVLFTWIFIDKTFLNIYDNDIHLLLALFSSMPLIGNLVVYAAENNLHPEKAAMAVLISTILAIGTIPAAYFLYQWLF